MNRIQTYPIELASTASSSSITEVDKYDQLMFYVPAVASVFSSSAVRCTLQGSVDGSTMQNMNYYDYVNKTPSACQITISTGGIYEFPYPGASQYVKVVFDIPASQATSAYLMAPKTTY